MRRLKKHFFGYSPAEVEGYLAELEQQKKMLIENKRKVISNEILHIEEILGKYKEEELQLLDMLNEQLAVHAEVVQQAREKAQILKRDAFSAWQMHEEKLQGLQKLLKEVCEQLQLIKEDLQAANKPRKPALSPARGLNDARKTV